LPSSKKVRVFAIAGTINLSSLIAHNRAIARKIYEVPPLPIPWDF
jgi:hypothetical protein